MSGDRNHIDSINQIGQQHHYYGSASDQSWPMPDITAKWSWKSPLTQARLAWAGVILAIIPIASAYNLIKPLLDGSALSAFGTSEVQSNTNEQWFWIVALIVSGMLVLAIVSMWRVVRRRLHVFSPLPFLPVMSECDGHLALAKYEGVCSRCGGELRFYNKPTAWRTESTSNGGTREKVSERTMVAECSGNPKLHVWPLDTTETILSYTSPT